MLLGSASLGLSRSESAELAELLSGVDLASIALSLEEQHASPKFVLDEAKECIWQAVETWLLHDYKNLKIEGIEERLESGLLKGYVDLRGTITATSGPLSELSGKKFVLDWKTAGRLDAVWKIRLKLSWQWRIYCYLAGASVFVYRGISRAGDVSELILPVPPDNSAQVVEHVKRLERMRESLGDPRERWPRSLSQSACFSFGSPCAYLDFCTGKQESVQYDPEAFARVFPHNGGTGPQYPLWSYSTAGTFLACPERYRLNLLLGQEEDTEAQAFGSFVHFGLAEIWRQVFGLERSPS